LSWRVAGVLGLCVVLGCGFAYLVRQPRPLEPSLSSSSEMAPATPLASSRTDAAAREVTKEQLQNVRLHGVVRDALFGEPLAASIRLDPVVFWADSETGRFDRRLRARIGDTVEIRCAGYETWRGRVTGSDDMELNVALSGGPAGVVRVVDQHGAAIAGAEVRAAMAECAPVRLGITDENGMLRVTAPPRSSIWAVRTPLQSEPALWGGGAASDAMAITLWLSTLECSIGLRNEGGEPLPGQLLRLKRLDSMIPVVFELETGPEGVCEGAVPPGIYAVTSPRQTVQFDSRQDFSYPPVYVATAQRAYVRCQASGEAVWIRGAPLEGLRVRPQETTGERIARFQAWIEGFEDQFGGVGWVKVGTNLTGFADPNGVSMAPLLSTLPPAMQRSKLRLRIAAPGHEVLDIESPLQALSETGVTTVVCKRLQTGLLRIVTTEGVPFRRRVVIRQAATSALSQRLIIADGCPDENGYVRGVPIGDFEVTLHLSRDPWAPEIARIQAGSFQGEGASVALDADATLRVRLQSNDQCRLSCSKEGVILDGVREANMLIFDQLLPGDYYLGPREYLQSPPVREGRASSGLVTVRGGQTQTVDCPWPQASPMTGHVLASGIPPEQILAAPRFGSRSRPAFLTGLESWARVSPGQTYRIDEPDVRPTHVLFMHLRPDGQRVVLAHGDLDTPARVDCARVSVIVEGPSRGEAVAVGFRPLIDGLEPNVTFCWVRGFTSQPIDLGYVPCSTNMIHVRAAATTTRVALDVAPGDVQTLRVDVRPKTAK